jgi:hypothetical protein
MPVFNWDDNDVPILKSGFGYYMAVTLPLTFIVLLIWRLSMRIRQGKKIWSHNTAAEDCLSISRNDIKEGANLC